MPAPYSQLDSQLDSRLAAWPVLISGPYSGVLFHEAVHDRAAVRRGDLPGPDVIQGSADEDLGQAAPAVALGDLKPAFMLTVIPGLIDPRILIEIEAWAARPLDADD